ncbi:MAG: cyclic nucleotide-binding domain-containing protein [Candidatus Brocadiae bacterium]|nr:cyclic nucleotide-binding domain-containing protein [Candidatus Brocadiia bacterium]
MKSIDDLLTEQPLFSDLDPEHRRLVAGCGRLRRFEAGAWILKEGAAADMFYSIRKGQVALGIHVPERGDVVIETVGEGGVLGWSWLFPPYKVQFDARAVTAAATIEFDGACLRRKCDADPVLGYALMKRFASVMAARLQATRVQFLDVYGNAR